MSLAKLKSFRTRCTNLNIPRKPTFWKSTMDVFRQCTKLVQFLCEEAFEIVESLSQKL